MKMEIFKRAHVYLDAWSRFVKCREIAIKTFLALLIPGAIAFVLVMVWKYLFHDRSIHFSDKLEVMITTPWITVFGIFYSIMMGIVFTTVWKEYKIMRMAVKEYDIDTFMKYKDEDMSPLVYGLIVVCSGVFLACFMGVKYPDFTSGAILVGCTSYLISLIFFVIKEIDNPCAGFWFIKSTPELWLQIDAKLWRTKMLEAKRKETDERCEKFMEMSLVA